MLPQWPLSEINGPAIISTTSTHQRLYIRSAKQPQLHFSSDYGKWANQLKALEATPIPFAEGLAKFVPSETVATCANIWGRLPHRFSAIWEYAPLVFAEVWSQIPVKMARVWNSLPTVLPDVWEMLPSAFTKEWERFPARFALVWGKFPAIFAAVWLDKNPEMSCTIRRGLLNKSTFLF